MLIYLAKMYSASSVSQDLGLGDAVRIRYAWSSPHGNDSLLLPLNLRIRHLSHKGASVPTFNSIWRLPGNFPTWCPGEWVEKSKPTSVLNSIVLVTVLQPLLLVSVDLECRSKVSVYSESCIGKERLSIYPPRFSGWVYEINWQQTHWRENITDLFNFNITCMEISQEKNNYWK